MLSITRRYRGINNTGQWDRDMCHEASYDQLHVILELTWNEAQGGRRVRDNSKHASRTVKDATEFRWRKYFPILGSLSDLITHSSIPR